MPFSFPSSPTVGQQSTQNGRVYSWTGSAWELVPNAATFDAANLTGTVALARLPVVLEQTQTVGNSGTSTALALTTGSVQTVTLNGNCTFTMPSPTAGASITLILTQGGTFTATFTGVLWAGGTAPTITATANKVDVLVFVSNGTSWFGTASQNH
jgi:hypothetical protein